MFLLHDADAEGHRATRTRVKQLPEHAVEDAVEIERIPCDGGTRSWRCTYRRGQRGARTREGLDVIVHRCTRCSKPVLLRACVDAKLACSLSGARALEALRDLHGAVRVARNIACTPGRDLGWRYGPAGGQRDGANAKQPCRNLLENTWLLPQ